MYPQDDEASTAWHPSCVVRRESDGLVDVFHHLRCICSIHDDRLAPRKPSETFRARARDRRLLTTTPGGYGFVLPLKRIPGKLADHELATSFKL